MMSHSTEKSVHFWWNNYIIDKMYIGILITFFPIIWSLKEIKEWESLFVTFLY